LPKLYNIPIYPFHHETFFAFFATPASHKKMQKIASRPLNKASVALPCAARRLGALLGPVRGGGSLAGGRHSRRSIKAMAVPLQLAIPLVGAGAILAAAWLDARLKSRKPDLVYAPTEFNEAVLANCPTLLRFLRAIC
jgi:hypothetical protein